VRFCVLGELCGDVLDRRFSRPIDRIRMPDKKLRLDALIVERGLIPSRERARALILAGQVTVDGQVVSKAGAAVAPSADVALALPDHPYVGRGGIKLAHALDVGRGQLDWKLRTDPRVIVREGVNARALSEADVPHAVDLVTIDVAFISLRYILPALPPRLAAHTDIVALVKPQFEAGRQDVGKGGLVLDPAVHERVIAEVSDAALHAGFTRVNVTPSPITGATGNREFFLHLQYDGLA